MCARLCFLFLVFSFSQLSYAKDFTNFGVGDKDMLDSFKKDGFVVLKGFYKRSAINEALEEYKRILRSFPQKNLGQHFFSTADDNKAQSSDEYFFKSATEIWPFYNPSILNNMDLFRSDLTQEQDLFRYISTINKVGHNLHNKNTVFKNLITRKRAKELIKNLGYLDASTEEYLISPQLRRCLKEA